MQTNTKLVANDTKQPEIELQSGQFYKYTYREVSIWQIVRIGHGGFTLICVIPDPKNKFDQGTSYDGQLHTDISEVFGPYKKYFKFISDFTGSIG